MKGLIRDERGVISHKRLIALACTLILCIVFLVNTIFPKTVTPSTSMIEAITYIIIACVAGSSADKFSYKQPLKPTKDEVISN